MKFKKRIEILVKKNSFFQALYSFFGSLLFRFIGLFVKQNKKMILFSSYGGDSINDSPKVIYDYIKKHYEGYNCVWVVNKPENRVLEDAKYVTVDTFKYFITCLKAKYWVTNVNIERGLHFKKKKTFYLNTWHSTTVKTIGNQVKGRKDYNFKNINLLCSDGSFMTNIFIKYFNAPIKSIFECGRPREDELFEKNEQVERERILKKYNIDNSSFVVLYAPTWKDTNGREDLLSASLNLNKLVELVDKKIIILFKTHHLTKNASGVVFNENIIDVSDCQNINELYFAADILISDYSSCFFDFGLLGKPIICFAPDLQEYELNRGLCVDLRNDFPGGVISDEKQLASRIVELKKGTNCFAEEQKLFMDKYLSRPTASATRFCVDKMFEK